MASIDLPKSPMVFHPEKRSAVGSRNSLAQESRDQQVEVDRLLEEEVDKVMNHIASKLPKEVLVNLDVMGGLKEKLFNYFNQNYQNMFNRYMVTTEDEMLKKVRNFIDREEMKVLTRYTPKEIATLLDEVAGADKFNTGEIEKSIVNMYGHLQGHIQRGVNNLENVTNSLLRQKTDVGQVDVVCDQRRHSDKLGGASGGDGHEKLDQHAHAAGGAQEGRGRRGGHDARARRGLAHLRRLSDSREREAGQAERRGLHEGDGEP